MAGNRALPWDDALVVDVALTVKLRVLEGNPGIQWSGALIARLQPDLVKIADRGSFQVAALRELADRLPWRSLSANRNLPWTAELVQEHQARWDWELLAANPALPWTKELLGAWAERWVLKGLARNPVAGPILAQGLHG
jgi:hypothetical protein